MSLINDALKKAQRDRSGTHPSAPPPPADTPPSAPPPPAATAPAASSSSSGFKGWPIVAAIAVIVLGVLGWRLLAPSSEKPETVASADTPAVTAPAPAASQPEAQPTATAPTEEKTESVAPAVATPENQKPVEVAKDTPPPAAPVTPPQPKVEEPPAVDVKIEPAKTEQPPPMVAVNIPAATTPAPASTQELPATMITIPEGPAAPSTAAPLVSVRQQDPRILAYLDALVVNGIRPSPDDPKVLMNNRVFRVRDVVDRELNLKLTAIAPAKLTFEDERGMLYVKNF